MRGLYTLIIDSDEQDLCIGKLRLLHFNKGYYAYTGSARGRGGLLRVRRHIAVSRGENTARKWHIDYLLAAARPVRAVTSETDADMECEIAGEIGKAADAVPGFGCSDCGCVSHLHYAPARPNLERAVISAHMKYLGCASVQDI
ncbi:MAG TPA: DUF123 domain-containing protein [Candidatus Methanoperedenaceae archaeon]|nr:DUF123 domain-containing protein [Candidatus Methanoperedenaceae archaeon]